MSTRPKRSPTAAKPAAAPVSAVRPSNTRRVVRGVPHSRVSFMLPDELLARARNATLALSGPPAFLRFGALVQAGIAAEVARLEKKHAGGKPFAASGQALRGGRRVNP